jgi:hypothetical protein
MMNRDGDSDGVMDLDSSRCGNGYEITTYDSLDSSLGQARNNLYLAVKTWSAYVVLSHLFRLLDKPQSGKDAEERAQLCASTIIGKFNPKDGCLPAVFEENNSARIIPAIEGLIYPYVIRDSDAVSGNGRFANLIGVLKKHIVTVLKPGVCIDAASNGWKLSSTSNNTWMSKIFINQFIVEKILRIPGYDWGKWDVVHASWQQGPCGSFACTDQVQSDTGRDLGSRLYPRLVTSILWLKY